MVVWKDYGEWKYYVGDWGGALGEEGDITRENFASRCDAMAQVLLGSFWYKSQGKDEHEREKSDLSQLIKELQAADWVEKGNEVLAKIYSLANEQRAWLNPLTDDD